MALWDLLKNIGNNTKAVNTQPLQLVQVTPNEQGGLDSQVTTWQPRPTKAQNMRRKLTDLLLGQAAQTTDNIGTQAGEPVTMKDEITGEMVTYNPENVSTISETPRVGGLLPDFTGGFRENLNNGFNLSNFGNNTLADGRKKGFAYRLGEGLGSVVRFLDSTPGRALLTAGAVGLAGGNGADMLAYGLQGGSLNNRLRTQDRMYRDEMLRNAYNSLMNSPEYAAMTDEQRQAAIDNLTNQVNGMRGYVTDDMYKNFVTAQQLRDNADWKKLYFDSQQEQNRIMNGIRQDQLDFQKLKAIEDRQDKAAQRAIAIRGQDMSYGAAVAKAQIQAAKDEQKRIEKLMAKQEETNNVIHQLGVLQDLHSKLPQNYAPKGFKKAAAISTGVMNMTGLPSNELAAFSGAKNIVTNMIARKIGGEKGVMTDRDFERAKQMTPNEFDTPAQAEAKIKAIYSLMGVDYPGSSGKSANMGLSVDNNALNAELKRRGLL